MSVIRDRIAIFNSNFAEIRTDESAHFNASVTSIIESLDAKGTAGAIGDSIGRDAPRRAHDSAATPSAARSRSLHGARPAAGKYRVVLGPQPVAEILNYMVMGSLTTGAFHAASSAYHAKFGAPVMDSRLNLADDPAFRGGCDSPANHLRRNPRAPCRIDSRRQAGRPALEFLRHSSHAHRRASRRKAWRQRAREARLPSAERLPAWRRRRAALRRESRLGGHQRRDARARRRRRPRTGAHRRRRNLRRPHLVHLSDQRPARGRFHLHRHRRFVHYSRRQNRRAARAQLFAHQREHRAGLRASARGWSAPATRRRCGDRPRPTTFPRSPPDSIALAEVAAT